VRISNEEQEVDGGCDALSEHGMAMAGTPALLAKQTDESGQVTNPQPHTQKELKQEKSRRRRN
jgi:hypothetical protein